MSFPLTDEQKAVVDHPLGQHARILAGPGTGKSATAVALAAALLSLDPPPKLKFLTFTRAATAELAKKIEKHGIALERPSTIHSFSISTLLQNPGCAAFPQPLRIPSDEEYYDLIRPQLAALAGVGLTKLDDLMAEMSAKWESLSDTQRTTITAAERERFIAAWLQHRRIYGYTLRSELPDLFRRALRDHSDLRGVNYDIIIVDEYQDLNACDLEVLRRLAERNVAVVGIGDDDQSIYSFRKAAPEGIRRFLEEYQTTHDYHLTICHRCMSSLLGWAQHVIHTDPQSPSLKRLSVPEGAKEGTAKLLSFRSNQGELNGVVALVKWLHEEQKVPYGEILILSRSARHTLPIKNKLTELHIPICDSDAVDRMLAESNNQFCISLLRLIDAPDDSLAWCCLLSHQDGIGERLIESVYQKAIDSGRSFGETFVAEATNGLPDAPATSRNLALALWQRVSNLLANCQLPTEQEGMRWGAWIIQQMNEGRLTPCTPELQSLFIKLDEKMEENAVFRRFLSQIHPLGSDILNAASEGVRFMSMTSSKGLTVTATIMVGVDSDLIPHPRGDRSEERRLLYVAMTRATDYLFMTWATRRIGPVARSGHANVRGMRQHTEFLEHGPVESEDGEQFLQSLRQPQPTSSLLSAYTMRPTPPMTL